LSDKITKIATEVTLHSSMIAVSVQEEQVWTGLSASRYTVRRQRKASHFV